MRVFKGIVSAALTILFVIPVGAKSVQYYNPAEFPGEFYFSLAPEVKVVGPIYNETPSGEYMKNVFGYIVQKANELAEIYYEDDRRSYYTWLVTALVVPHHESRLTQFRKVSPKKCWWKTNELENMDTHKIRGAKISNRALMEPIYRDLKNPIVPNCDYLASQPSVVQAILSGFQADFSIMQMHIASNPEFVHPHTLLNMYNSIDAGLTKHLYPAFRRVRENLLTKYDGKTFVDRNDKTYSCDGMTYTQEDPVTFEKYKRVNYPSIVRGVWSGKYNTGNLGVAGVCRFVTKDKKDENFKNSLIAITNTEKEATIAYFQTFWGDEFYNLWKDKRKGLGDKK